MNTRTFKSIMVLSLLLISLVNMTTAAPGDTRAEAEEIYLGETTGELTSSADHHWYELDTDPNKSLIYDIDLYGPSNTDFDMVIEDEYGNTIEGIYGISYPDSASVRGHDTYYLDVYSASGSGEFTIEITERSVKLGETPSNPIQLELGDNSISFLDIDNKFAEFNSENGSYYRFDIIVLSDNSYIDGYFSNSYSSGRVHNSSDLPGNARSAYLLADLHNISASLYFTGEAKNGEVIVRVSEVPAPDGVDPDNPVQLIVDQPRNVSIYEGIESFFSFVVEDSEYYSLQFEGLEGSDWANMDLSGPNSEQYFNVDNRGIIYFQSSPGNHTMEISSHFSIENMTITLTRDAPPMGYSRDNPIPLGETEVSSKLFGDALYLQPDVEQGSSYFLNWATVSEEELDIEFRFEYDGQQSYSFASDSQGSTYFYAESDPMIINLRAWSPDFIGNITLSLESTTNPDHVSMEDAKVASLGSTSGEVQYQNQPFWFEFTAPESQLYSFDLDAGTNDYMGMQLVDSFGNPIDWSDSSSGIEYNVGQDEVVYIQLFSGFSNSAMSFTLNIYEGELREEVREIVYSQNLQTGDYFEWSVESYQNGEPVVDDTVFSHGSSITLDVLVDSPVVSEQSNHDEYFQVTYDGDQDAGLGVSLFLVPVEIREGGRTIATGEDLLMDRYDGSNAQISESNGQLIISESDTDGDESMSMEVIFDAEDMYLISLHYVVDSDFESMELHFDLTDSRISGPPENITENEPPLELPISMYSALLAILMLPVIRRRFN